MYSYSIFVQQMYWLQDKYFRYYSICFLNQLMLTQEDRLLAAKLVNVYFSFFKVMCFTYDLKSVNEGADKYETGINVTRTTKKTPLTTFMKGEEWRLFLSFLFKSDKFLYIYIQYTYIVGKYKIYLYEL
jgi:hypothetical protein